MCGIVGVLNLDGRACDMNVVAAMRDALIHRGPDGAGLLHDGAFGMGNRRLAVLDLTSAGEQPMRSPDGRYAIIHNGEIYGIESLKKELTREGWRFRSRTDTEVLLAGFVLWGVDALMRRIDGMTAFAVWDTQLQRLTLARDRYGCKPLYLWRAARSVAFASEIKAFLQMPDFRARLNHEALKEYFTFQNVFRFHTLFADVEQVPPATIVEIDHRSERRRVYWSFDFTRRDAIDPEFAVAETLRLFKAAVERQIVADRPVGAYLSGGMDSGSIVACATRDIPRMCTFTAGFEMSSVDGPEVTFDERRPAELMANHFRTTHHELVLNAGDVRWALPEVIWHLEDLRLGMCYQNYYVARLASKFVTVCLSGAGGDEIFAGYPWRYYRVFKALDAEAFVAAYFQFWQRLTSAHDRAAMFRARADAAGDEEMVGVFRSVLGNLDQRRLETPEDHIATALEFECRTFLPGLLTVGDRLSMAHSLEERFPFLDNDLVDFVQRLPIEMKLADLHDMRSIDEDAVRKKLLAQEQFGGGKNIMRQAMAGLMPAAALERPKQGFSAPDASWYRGENAAFVKAFLLDRETVMSTYIDPDFVRKTVDDHLNRRANNRLLIWSFLCFEWWCRIFLEGERPAA